MGEASGCFGEGDVELMGTGVRSPFKGYRLGDFWTRVTLGAWKMLPVRMLDVWGQGHQHVAPGPNTIR